MQTNERFSLPVTSLETNADSTRPEVPGRQLNGATISIRALSWQFAQMPVIMDLSPFRSQSGPLEWGQIK
jgi:hypothetical protein